MAFFFFGSSIDQFTLQHILLLSFVLAFRDIKHLDQPGLNNSSLSLRPNKNTITMSGFFGTRHKLAVHLTQAAVVVVVLTLAGVRLFTRPKNVPMVRTDSMALAIVSLRTCPLCIRTLADHLLQGVKSHVVIFYQILTEHYPKFRRWASLKANLILNSLEIVFWAAVAFMGIQANTQTCDGTRCILSWIVVGLGIALR